MGGRKSDFVWGSNANAANQGILLIQVYLITRNRKYLDAALGNLDYILRKKCHGILFYYRISAIFPPCIRIIVHLLQMVLQILYRDYLQEDRIRESRIIVTMIFTNRKHAYVDSDCAYASNEIAINWNAPLVYLVECYGGIAKLTLRNSK